MTAGCISKTADITTFIYNIQGDRQLDKSKFINKRVDIFSNLCKIVIKYGFYRLYICFSVKILWR